MKTQEDGSTHNKARANRRRQETNPQELLVELQNLRMENAYLKKLRALVQAQQKATPLKKRK
jgi:hypothetical protein